METQNATRIFHVQGNDLKLAMPLTRRTVVTVNGKPTEIDTDFFPSGEVTVFLTRNFHSYKYEAEVAGNVITVNDDGKLPVGTYAITVYCKDGEGHRMRLRHPEALEVVDNTADGGTYRSGEYDSEAHYLTVNNRVSAIVITDEAVFLEVGGGVGADDDPDDDEYTAYSDYGEGHIEVKEDEVSLYI